MKNIGYTSELENYRKVNKLETFDVGRVVSEHKERYIVRNKEREYEAEIVGNFRYSAKSRADFPAVGDWVAISAYMDDKVLIHSVFPRKTLLERKATGKQGETQIIAANVDYAFVVQALDRDFSINRIERYITICYDAAVEPIVVLSKIDLVSSLELENLVNAIRLRIKDVQLLTLNNLSLQGMEQLRALIKQGKTYCLLGSSGVGKSTLINNLLGETRMKTDSVSATTNRGKHVTTHRQLHVLESGGIVIDNPGMREVGIKDSLIGLEVAFDNITELANGCRYKNCTHTLESGCAVIQALEDGNLNKESYKNYLRMEKERKHYESTLAERRRKGKDLGKIIKDMKKKNINNKY